MSSAEKRRQLFNLYSNHIKLYEPDKGDIFLCPLCMQAFGPDAVQGPEPLLTLAHIIPAQLGGTACTLACAKCNNDNGAELESYLVERFIAEDGAAGLTRIPGRFVTPVGSIGVEFQLPSKNSNKTLSVYPVPAQSNPADVKAVEMQMQRAASGESNQFEFTLKHAYRHQPRRVESALYQSVYLMMFSLFGYEFVLHPHFEPLRNRVLQRPDCNWKTRVIVPSEETVASVLRGRKSAVMMLREPAVILAFLQLRPKGGGQERTLAVVLPGLDNPVLPEKNWQAFHGSILTDPPAKMLNTKFSLFKYWRKTRKAVS